MLRIVLFLILLVLMISVAEVESSNATSSSPSLTVFFERQSVRQKDCVNVELLLANDGDYELAKPMLTVSGPSFLTWFTDSCEGKDKESGWQFALSSNPVLSLDHVPAKSMVRQKLHFHSAPTIEVGDYNSLFTLQYELALPNGTTSSFVTSEKPIKVNFLGNESVAGVPMALAGFIIPGLVFWWLVKLFRASWAVDGLQDQMVYSVLVSVGLVFTGSWLGFSDLSTGLSIPKLTYLAIAGLVAGLVVGAGDLIIRQIRKSRAAKQLEQQIKQDENEADLLGKLLELPASQRLNKPVIELKDGRKFVGALGARTKLAEAPSGGSKFIYSLVGSFSVALNKVTDGAVNTQLVQLKAARQMRKFVTLANEKKVLDPVEGIHELKPNDELENTGNWRMQWPEDQVSDAKPETAGWDTPTLAVE